MKDRDLPDLAAQRRAERDAGDVGDLVAHREIRQVANFFRSQSVAAHGEQADRQAGDAELIDRGWIDARRQQADDAVGQAGQLRLRRVDAVLGLEEHLDVAHARERLRFDMFDIARFDKPLLHAKRDRPFHLAWAQPAIKGRDQNRRDFDFRKNIDAHLLVRHGTKQQSDHADGKHRVRIFQGGSRQHVVSTQ